MIPPEPVVLDPCRQLSAPPVVIFRRLSVVLLSWKKGRLIYGDFGYWASVSVPRLVMQSLCIEELRQTF
jgi:hypothetical protein